FQSGWRPNSSSGRFVDFCAAAFWCVEKHRQSEISDGRIALLSATLGHRGNAGALFINLNAKSLRQPKMPAWTRHPHLPGATLRAPRILATGCADSATATIQRALGSATTVARRCI